MNGYKDIMLTDLGIHTSLYPYMCVCVCVCVCVCLYVCVCLCTQDPDGYWIEIIKRGGYDDKATPFWKE